MERRGRSDWGVSHGGGGRTKSHTQKPLESLNNQGNEAETICNLLFAQLSTCCIKTNTKKGYYFTSGFVVNPGQIKQGP